MYSKPVYLDLLKYFKPENYFKKLKISPNDCHPKIFCYIGYWGILS